MWDIICISHLRWDFVWQRPQHLLSRLGKERRVLFVEEPVSSITASEPHLEAAPCPKNRNVTVMRLIQPVEEERWIGHGDPLTQETYSRLLHHYVKINGQSTDVLWLYTPMAMDFMRDIPHRLLVFDVMDQLSAFKGAPAELVARDKEVLRQAGLVFTGGASLFRDKQPYNPDTYLFPSGVETRHFAGAADRSRYPRPTDLNGISEPIIGYYGVIDERMDLDLIAHIAGEHPEWQIVMIGPVVKIDPAALPRAGNIHYLGMKTYDELPAYLAAFDVALVPFALNEATRYLSPTKTLEYMAAHKPIVSTAIHDVIELYGEVVRVGHSHEEIASHIEAALKEEASLRRHKELELLRRYNWDGIADQMKALIEACLGEAA